MHFRNILLIIFISLIIIHSATSEENTAVFIVTSPLNCNITVNGEKQKNKTPVLLKTLNKGKHRIEISKHGYKNKKVILEVEEDTNKIINISLQQDFFTLNVSDNEKTKNYNLINGNYTISNEDNISVEPEYPKQKYIDSLNIIIPVMGGFSAALTVNELSNPRYDDALLSPFVLSTYIVNTLFISADIMLHLNKNKFKDRYSRINHIEEKTDLREYFILGNRSVEEGFLDEALSAYNHIIDTNTDSEFYPYALYKAGAIHMIQNNHKKASNLYDRIITEYPMPDLYDKALKNLAEISIREKKYDKAVTYLNEILYITNLYSKEDIMKRIQEITETAE